MSRCVYKQHQAFTEHVAAKIIYEQTRVKAREETKKYRDREGNLGKGADLRVISMRVLSCYNGIN